jgi:hypothetical protein
MEITMMNIALDRRHAFYLDAEDQPHPLLPHRFDRLWRGEPDAAMPVLAGQRIRFAVFHTERFTSPPRIVLEHYPFLTLDDRGHVDVMAQHTGLQAEVDALEDHDYAPTPTRAAAEEPATTWDPTPAIRRRLLALLGTSTSYRARMNAGAGTPRVEEPRPTYRKAPGGVQWRATVTRHRGTPRVALTGAR